MATNAVTSAPETGDNCRELTENTSLPTETNDVQPAAAETYDIIVASSTNNTSLPTEDIEVRDARILLAEYNSIHNNLKTKALAAHRSVGELVPLLITMHGLLSQRGNQHLRGIARLPTWTEYYRGFTEVFDLPSLRTFQRYLASTEEKRRVNYNHMLTTLLTQIETLGVGAPITATLMDRVAEYRKALSAEPPVPEPINPNVFNLTVAQVRRIGKMPRKEKLRRRFDWPEA
jgi:hypothetical protein